MTKGRQDQSSDKDNSVKGLPMFTASAPEILAKEKADLAELEGKSTFRRWRGYLSKTGPGWLQSALVLGSGSAMASLLPEHICSTDYFGFSRWQWCWASLCSRPCPIKLCQPACGRFML